MTKSQGWGTTQFQGMLGNTEERWRSQVLPEMQNSESFQARVQQDPFLREAYAVLTAETEEASVEAASRLRSRWFPFHALNDNNSERVAWLEELHDATSAESQERGSSEQEIAELLSAQQLWLAVLRSPLKLTGVEIWKQGQNRWRQEYLAAQSASDGGAASDDPGYGYTPPSPGRFITEMRLLAMESLNTALLCEVVGKRLGDDHKAVLQLTYVVGLMEDGIAEQMGIARDDVSHLKRYALGSLRAEAVK